MMSLVKQSRDNSVTVTRNLLKSLKIPVTEDALEDTIFTHPYYPSLLSISDSLQHWNIETVAVNATTVDELNELPLPFIVHFKTKGGQFAVIKNLTSDEIIFLNEQGKEQELNYEEFIRQWNGVVLVAEIKENSLGQSIPMESEEMNYKKHRQKEWLRRIRLPIGLIILLILGIAQTIKFIAYDYPGVSYYTALAFLSFIGILITGLLLWHEYDGSNPLLQKVCSVGKHSSHSLGRTGCQAILSSKASKAIGSITWSEIGFIYFTGSYLYLLISGVASFPLLMTLNFLALPYILYSIYYQARIAKQWCVLCLSVQSLLLLEFLSALFTNQLAIQQFNNLTIELFILSFFLPSFAWFFSKPSLYTAKRGKQLRFQLARIKNNEDVFSALLQKQTPLKQSTDGMGITIGNPQAPNTLIKVCNPYCAPCARAHPKIEALIQKNLNWKVQIIFTATGEEKDKRTAPAAHLLAIAAKHDEAITQQALDDWYNADKKEYSLFASKYPMDGEIQLQKENLQAMDKWCNAVGISATPTFFVKYSSLNKASYKLPKHYGLEDLIYLY